jgi:hypothetical protein
MTQRGVRRMARGALVLAALWGTVVCRRDADSKPAGAAADQPERAEKLLRLPPEAVERAGIEIASATPGHRESEVDAYGRVLDPAPVVAAISDREAARAAADAGRRELARLESLAKDDQNASARDVEVARAEAARMSADFAAADARLLGVLGTASRETADLASLARQLGRREVALVRIDAPADRERPRPENGARLTAYPRAGGELDARYLGPALDTDPTLPGWSFLFLVSRNPPPAGAPVRAQLRTESASISGVIVPASALIHHGGGAFVFVARGPGAFERREVAAEALADGRQFLSDGVAEGEGVVVSGAEELLSAELLAARGAREPD